ncbi:hypothetical protein METH_00380 [Leisingera methylohalidivorans DSM 14336]|uniref:Alcohol dehydrogenase-like N-terminal domain-containing protein n=1 Tax=Leisingera methylohalidivorans DSM 14336 TaxID=999552 RepID=V9VVP5_9RHOB|nr:hypothetical protein METH_00380 [Leisingera methylohalidivorans DSM 14336]
MVHAVFDGLQNASDLSLYLCQDNRRPAPLIRGHEAAGLIEDGPKAGRRVTIPALVTCGACASGRENLCGSRQIISMSPRGGAIARNEALRAAKYLGRALWRRLTGYQRRSRAEIRGGSESDRGDHFPDD